LGQELEGGEHRFEACVVGFVEKDNVVGECVAFGAATGEFDGEALGEGLAIEP
jgi:hypothetical protein